MKKKAAKAVFLFFSKKKRGVMLCKAVFLAVFLVLMYAGVCASAGRIAEGEEAYTYFLALTVVLSGISALFGVDRT